MNRTPAIPDGSKAHVHVYNVYMYMYMNNHVDLGLDYKQNLPIMYTSK